MVRLRCPTSCRRRRRPGRVPDRLVEEIRQYEVDGLIELPKPAGMRSGDRVRVVSGPFAGQLGLYAGMRPRARVEVLLTLLGSQQRVELSKDSIEAV